MERVESGPGRSARMRAVPGRCDSFEAPSSAETGSSKMRHLQQQSAQVRGSRLSKSSAHRYVRRMSNRAIAVVAILFAPMSSACSECEVPSTTQYNCQPVAEGSAGCQGGPIWHPGPSDAGKPQQDDPELIFPFGCQAQIPDCSGYYKGSLRTFTCSVGQSGGIWGEAL